MTTVACNCATGKQIQAEKVSQIKMSQNKLSQTEMSQIEMSELEKKVPLYVITATYPRLEQLAELTRLGQTLKVKKGSIHAEAAQIYRFPSLFAVDTFS